MEAQRDEGGGRILLGNNMGRYGYAAAALGPVWWNLDFTCAALCVCVYIVDLLYSFCISRKTLAVVYIQSVSFTGTVSTSAAAWWLAKAAKLGRGMTYAVW
jgi:hypothetical protein